MNFLVVLTSNFNWDVSVRGPSSVIDPILSTIWSKFDVSSMGKWFISNLNLAWHVVMSLLQNKDVQYHAGPRGTNLLDGGAPFYDTWVIINLHDYCSKGFESDCELQVFCT